jgi:glutamate dehydrogenase/leucine dehydrogenase
VEVFPDAKSRTMDRAEAGWDITSPAAADEAVTKAAHKAASCKTIWNATHYPTSPFQVRQQFKANIRRLLPGGDF